MKFDDFAYLADSRSWCLKIFASLYHTAKFLTTIGSLFKTFSVHEKKKIYKRQSLLDAISLLKKAGDKTETYERCIREKMLPPLY